MCYNQSDAHKQYLKCSCVHFINIKKHGNLQQSKIADKHLSLIGLYRIVKMKNNKIKLTHKISNNKKFIAHLPECASTATITQNRFNFTIIIYFLFVFGWKMTMYTVTDIFKTKNKKQSGKKRRRKRNYCKIHWIAIDLRRLKEQISY